MTWILRLFTGLKTNLVAILATAVAFLTTSLALMKAGREKERRKVAEKSVKTARKANAIREDVRRSSTPELNDKLRRYQRKQ